MSQFARVDSIDTLKAFRIFLCEFAEEIRSALDEADGEIQRTIMWLKQDQSAYWKAQLRKRTELLTRAKLALYQKQQEKTPTGGRYSCVDEKKALALAKQRLEEAQQKIQNVQRWIRRIDEETFAYKSTIQGMLQALEMDIPNATAKLDRMLTSLESYIRLAVAGEPVEGLAAIGAPDTGQGTESASMARSDRPPPPVEAPDPRRLRRQTPDQAARDAAPACPTPFQWSDGCEIRALQRETMAALTPDRAPPAADHNVVLARDIWNCPHIYLERIHTNAPNDSGWYLGFADDSEVPAHDSVHVADLLSIRPDWEEILALPAGYLIVLDRGTIEAVLDPRDKIVYPPGRGAAPGEKPQPQQADTHDDHNHGSIK